MSAHFESRNAARLNFSSTGIRLMDKRSSTETLLLVSSFNYPVDHRTQKDVVNR
jgi:hypothetical protein